MRALLLVLMTAALAACATTAPPSTPVTANGGASITGVATIARWGTWEMALAPAYTRLTLARHNANLALKRGRIDIDTAVQAQALADQARALLDRSRRGAAASPTDAQRADLDAALVLLATIDNLLGARP